MMEKIVKEVEIRVGKADFPAKLIVEEETEKEIGRSYDVFLYEVEYPKRSVKFKIGDFEQYITKSNLIPRGLWVYAYFDDNRKKLEKTLAKFLGKPVKLKKEDVVFVLKEGERGKIEKTLEEVEEFNRRRRKEGFSYPTRLVVVEKPVYDYLTLVLTWNKPRGFVEKDLREKFEEIKKLVKKADNWLVLDDMLIVAPKGLKKGRVLTLEEVEKLFAEELEKGKEILRKEKIEREKKEKELEEKRKKAIEEAKRTGKEVVIRTVYAFDGENPDPDDRMLFGNLIRELKRKYGDELGIIEIVEVATPDGKIIEKPIPSF